MSYQTPISVSLSAMIGLESLGLFPADYAVSQGFGSCVRNGTKIIITIKFVSVTGLHKKDFNYRGYHTIPGKTA